MFKQHLMHGAGRVVVTHVLDKQLKLNIGIWQWTFIGQWLAVGNERHLVLQIYMHTRRLVPTCVDWFPCTLIGSDCKITGAALLSTSEPEVPRGCEVGGA